MALHVERRPEGACERRALILSLPSSPCGLVGQREEAEQAHAVVQRPRRPCARSGAPRVGVPWHTLKVALIDPTLFSGIGNAYSDEILHRARLSPFLLTQRLDDAGYARLHHACITVLAEWTTRLIAESGDRFPEKVTAFRPGMAVHGRYGAPCPDCGTPVQRIRYADNETNYCPACQTEGRLLADRGLSRLLKDDWPRTVEELEELRRPPV